MKALKNNLVKKMIVLGALAILLGSLLFCWGSVARYTSQVDGIMQAEPALFNTVLLGDLVLKHNNGSEWIETNGKLRQDIVIDPNGSMDFGAVDGAEADLTTSERRLRPGSVVAIPFTVTNGTTLSKDGEEGNLAETDILFSLSLITTVNMPLKYDIYEYSTLEQLNYMKSISDDDYNYKEYREEIGKISDWSQPDEKWGRKLTMTEGEITSSEAVGRSRTYLVQPSADSGSKDGKFYLQRDTTGESIAVKRYMLVIYWPDIADGDPNGVSQATQDLRDTKYMKEIDILEIRLEVESWTQHSSVETPEYVEVSMPLLRLSKDPLGDEGYYLLPDSGAVSSANVIGRHTIPFYSTSVLGGNTRYLDFMITNRTEATSYTYDETADAYVASQITGLTGGKVAIAVPVQNTMGTANDYGAGYVYEMEYGGETYTGTLTDQYITTVVWQENEDPDTAGNQPNVDTEKNAYRIVVFEELTLPDFPDQEVSQVQLRLLVQTPEGASFDNKDDFKILIYKSEQEEEQP